MSDSSTLSDNLRTFDPNVQGTMVRRGNRITTGNSFTSRKKAKAISIRMLIVFAFLRSFEHFVLFFHAQCFIRQHVLFAQQQIFEKHFQVLFILFLALIIVEHEGIPEEGNMFAEERIVDM